MDFKSSPYEITRIVRRKLNDKKQLAFETLKKEMSKASLNEAMGTLPKNSDEFEVDNKGMLWDLRVGAENKAQVQWFDTKNADMDTLEVLDDKVGTDEIIYGDDFKLPEYYIGLSDKRGIAVAKRLKNVKAINVKFR